MPGFELWSDAERKHVNDVLETGILMRYNFDGPRKGIWKAKELEQEIKDGKLQISMGVRGITISFTQAALFPSGEDIIAPDTLPSIQKIARAMTQVPNPVRMEGHTDAIPIHNSRFRSNWELSAARSIALLELLVHFGEPRERMSIAGYAETAPVDNNQTETGRAKNRRANAYTASPSNRYVW